MHNRTITNGELATILENHKHWLNKDINGWEEMCADLSGVDLSGVDLRNVTLSGADLSHANLIDADLSNANLSSANLVGAFLTDANLSNANLRGADLTHTCLNYADLRGADLTNANLRLTCFGNAYLRGAKFNYPMACPDTGSFIGWKKCLTNSFISWKKRLTKTRFEDDFALTVIVKLLIPEDARRSSARGRKCRCDKAVVLDIEGADVAYSEYDHSFVYRKGETVGVDNFDDNRFNECAPGIHFFMNREEAVDYNLV